ncbi:MAG TPA: double zinc ribbon domain-containing protein [Gaiellaceae bacterium]
MGWPSCARRRTCLGESGSRTWPIRTVTRSSSRSNWHTADTNPPPRRPYARWILLELLLPQRCVGCDLPGEPICSHCLAGFHRLGAPLCERCGAPAAWPVRRCAECSGRRVAFASARAAVVYEGVVRAFVASWKERGLRRLAGVAADVVAEALEPPRVAVLTFVPPDGDRSLRRGHHPAERLARELGERWGLPVEPLLRRARAVDRQRGLSLAARRANVRDAFQAAGQPPTAIAVVDDVYTSGATASAAATALRKSGARRIEIVTFARAIR